METPVLQQAMRVVSDALALDGQHKSKEAYVRYLQCLQLVVHSLLTDAYHVNLTAGTPQKLIKLAQQCLDRVGNLADEVSHSGRQGSPIRPVLQNTSSGASTSIGPNGAPPSPMTPVSPSLPTFQPIGMDDDIDAGVKRRPRSLTPIEMAQRQNQQLMAAYKSRLARIQKRNPNYTNINLTLHRKLAENMAIAKAREEALAKKMKERQKRLEEQAARRFVATPGMSKEEQERRQLYTKILEYEHDAKWPLEWRERFLTNPDDPRLMQDLIKLILSYGDHPLTEMIARIQTTIYKKLEPLCQQFIGDLEHIKVPYIPSESVEGLIVSSIASHFAKVTEKMAPIHKVATEASKKCEEEESAKGEKVNDSYNISEQEGEASLSKQNLECKNSDHMKRNDSSNDVGLRDAIENSKTEIEEAMEVNETLVRQLTIEQEHVQDILDEVMTSSAEEQALEKEEHAADGLCIGKENHENSEELTESKVKHLQQEALERHLQHIVKDIHEALDRVLTMFIVAYEILDTPVGRDVTYSNIEEPFFKPIWPFLISLYRFVNRNTEEKIAVVMTEGLKLSPQEMGVKAKFLPQLNTPCQHEYPFSPVVSELCKVTTLVCPLSKLECIVRMVRAICQCVVEYDESHTADGLPNLGADDLLPIMMFVIVRSSMPQLVSECHVMEEFVHEGYLMGEEGYCLTSLQTSLVYMTRLTSKQSLAL